MIDLCGLRHFRIDDSSFWASALAMRGIYLLSIFISRLHSTSILLYTANRPT
jgi:hypothetical protein